MKENLTIGFIGNPNCGKTTLFNAYTGSKFKSGELAGGYCRKSGRSNRES